MKHPLEDSVNERRRQSDERLLRRRKMLTAQGQQQASALFNKMVVEGVADEFGGS
jgi:hypothetical protein